MGKACGRVWDPPAGEVHPSPAEWHGRRVQEAAPYGRYGPRRAGGHTGPPLRANRNISGRAGEDTRPYKIRGTLRSFRRGRSQTGSQERHPPPLRNGMGGASRRPRPTGVMVHGGRAGEDTRPCEIRGPIRSFRRGRSQTGSQERHPPPLRNGMGGASRRPRPTGVMVHGGRAGEDTRPCEIWGPLRSFRRGRTLAGP